MIKLKQFLGYAVAGMMGASLVLGANALIPNSNADATQAHQVDYKPVKMSAIYPTQSSMTGIPSSFNDAAKRATPAVVKIKTLRTQQQVSRSDNPFRFFFGEQDMFGPQVGSGSGVIISGDGYIVTNNHVVEDADEFEVILDDKRTFKAEKVGVAKRTDLAVLKIEATDLPTLEYANSDDVNIGDWVLAIGNPFEYLTSTVTAGIVSAKGRDINILRDQENIESFIQTDAAVNPGNSGGALVDLDGRLIGINTAIATQTGTFSGYSFAIPVNLMKKIAEDIIEFGSYKRAMLGVGIQPIDNEVAAEYGFDVRTGVLINSVSPGGAAELGGLLPLDIITAVDGRNVNSVPEIQELIGGKKVGEIVIVKIMRDGKQKELSVRLKEG
jgi:Do/DeqQ family serine protease